MSSVEENQPNHGALESDQVDTASRPDDSIVVDWDGPDDAANPQNWSSSKRWSHIVVVSLLALVTNMAPTMCAPAISQIVEEFQVTSSTVSTLAVTIYVLGLGIGPMFISPLSEVYGRAPVYHISNIVFVAFLVGNALSRNMASFLIFRFLSGFAGGTPMALGGGSIADITSPQTRASAMGLFSLGPLTGPILGPLIGGFVTAGVGWRWVFWLLTILGGATEVAAVVIMRETHARTLLQRKAARVRKATGNEKMHSVFSPANLTTSRMLAQALLRPTKLLVRSLVVSVMSLYVSLVFGLMYLLFTTFPDVFEGQYGFTISTSGLSYSGLGVALILALMVFRTIGERIRRSRMVADGPGQPRPELRLILMIWFSPFVGLGLFIYGWTADKRVHWIVPIIGTSIIGFGSFFVLMPTQLYLVDLFGPDAAASALGANNLLRFLSSTFLPLAGPPMYRALGLGWGNTLLGFLALAFVPAPILFYKYAERLHPQTVKLVL